MQATDANARLAEIFEALDDGEIARRPLFGHAGIATRGKVFVWAGKDGRLNAKLGDPRGAQLVAAGLAESSWMGPRQVREWYSFDAELDAALQLAVEARDFVRALIDGR